MRLKFSFAVLIIMVVCFGLSSPALAGANSKAKVYMEFSPTSNPAVVKVSVQVSGALELKGFDIEIECSDRSLVFLKEIEEGSLLASLGGKTFFMPQLKAGSLLWVANAVEGSGPEFTPSGEGELFSFKLENNNYPKTSIDALKVLKFTKIILADAYLNQDQVGGEEN